MDKRELAAEMLTRRLLALGSLDAAALASVADVSCGVRDFNPGQYLMREGDKPRSCALLLSGFVYRHKIVGDGGRQIVAVALPGDLIDVQQILLRHGDHNIQALTDASIALFPIEELLASAHGHPQVAVALWRYSLIEASITREWIANIGRRDARARTAHLLCELATRFEVAGLGARQTFELPMTQEQLGDVLGLTAVHVNRTLKGLQSDGLIVRSKRAVSVADWPGLRAAGDFSNTYLHLDEYDAATA